jgi:D-cysteine desulfhydrase
VLVHAPTPVFELPSAAAGSGRLWVKNDGVTNPGYGGNKVRKLERLLGEALRFRAVRLVTLGAAGSHHVLATTRFAREVGLPTVAVLTPQPWSDHAEATLCASLAEGLDARAAPCLLAVPARLAELWGPGDRCIPIGGSSVTGTLGYVDAMRELAAQIRAGELPEPDVVVAALGSGGTVAGLVAGAAITGLRCRVLGVCVAAGPVVSRALVLRLAWAAARRAGEPVSLRRLRETLIVGAGELGPGYGHPTERAAVATAVAREAGILLDPTYTAKAFAAALALVGYPALMREPSDIIRVSAKERPLTVVYWHTLSAAEPHGTLEASGLPPRFRALLHRR